MELTHGKMEIANIPIKDLKFAEYNPRKATEKEWKDLENSIREFGIVDPIVVNKNPARFNTIIGGHFRTKVAGKMGFTEMPVFYIDIADEKKERELMECF